MLVERVRSMFRLGELGSRVWRRVRVWVFPAAAVAQAVLAAARARFQATRVTRVAAAFRASPM